MSLKLVIANRGEIARRILKAGKERGWSVAVISTPNDKQSLVRCEADAVLEVDSFLHAEKIVQAAKYWGANVLHPGYGFLSENAHFAKLVEDAGIAFAGPTAEQMLRLGSKEGAKKIANITQVPVLQAILSHEFKNLTEEKNVFEELEKRNIIAPFLVKASGGGGGKGMRVVHDKKELLAAIERASAEALAAFGDGTVFVERYLSNTRHIEVQVFGDGKGGGVAFGERECSLQRRHQKVIEEAPSPVVGPLLRKRICSAALSLIKECKYRGAGTVEFLLDTDENFYFLEMNTRLQVEHPVTELVYKIDLVQAQLSLAIGEWSKNLPLLTAENSLITLEPYPIHAIEARILAEDPSHNFFPTPGPLKTYKEPVGEGIRIDSGVQQGSVIDSQFDSMIAKLIVSADTREKAIERLKKALENYVCLGTVTNITFLKNLVNHPDFFQSHFHTNWIEKNMESLISSPYVFFGKKIFEIFSRTDVKDMIKSSLLGIKREEHVRIFDRQQRSSAAFEIERDEKETGKFFLLELDEQRNVLRKHVFYLTRLNNEEVQIFCDGEILSITLPLNSRYAEMSVSSSGECYVTSPMAGKVLEIRINKDDIVTEGQILFVIESMKMQLEVKSPFSGRVEDVFVTNNEILPGPVKMALLSSEKHL